MTNDKMSSTPFLLSHFIRESGGRSTVGRGSAVSWLTPSHFVRSTRLSTSSILGSGRRKWVSVVSERPEDRGRETRNQADFLTDNGWTEWEWSEKPWGRPGSCSARSLQSRRSRLRRVCEGETHVTWTVVHSSGSSLPLPLSSSSCSPLPPKGWETGERRMSRDRTRIRLSLSHVVIITPCPENRGWHQAKGNRYGGW